MVNNTNEKSLTVIKENGLFTKVISFFKRIFGGKRQAYQYMQETNYDAQINQRRSFGALDDIQVKFENFRQGNIKEEDLSQQEKAEMTQIFRERIQKEEEEINYLRKKILQMRTQL